MAGQVLFGAQVRVSLAELEWEAGERRLNAPGRMNGGVGRVAAAVMDELRRRIGPTFTVAELVAVYPEAEEWFLPLAARVAPKDIDAWDPSLVLDGVFGRYRRQASDWTAS